METLIWILAACITISLVSLIGVGAFFIKESFLEKTLLWLVSLSAGALLAGAFFHMLPEALEQAQVAESRNIFLFLVIGFVFFFFLEQFIHWHHCHKTLSQHKSPVTYLVLVADTVHNFFDGLAIGSAFLVSVPVGITTWLVSVAHEIPQELGDFGVLVHGGWTKAKALLFNLFSSFSAIAGGLAAYFLAGRLDAPFLLAFSAGGFIYIACSDLIPEIKNKGSLKENFWHFCFFLLGLFLVFGISFWE